MSPDARTTSPRRGGAQPKPTIRELVDRELRRGHVALVADLPRRPSEAFDNLARGTAHPWRVNVRRWAEARDHGVPLAVAKREILPAIERALEALWDELPLAG